MPTIRDSQTADSPQLTVVGCFCLVKNDLLLVRRHRDKPFGSRWAIPAGKLKESEHPKDGIIRELVEETGLLLNREWLIELNDQFILGADGEFRFISYVSLLDDKPQLRLDSTELTMPDWVDLRHILKRRVVPFFWDGIHDLNLWYSGGGVQQILFAAPAATSARGWSTGGAALAQPSIVTPSL